MEFLDIFKHSTAVKYNVAIYNKIPLEQVFTNEKFWPVVPNYSLPTPKQAFVFDNDELKNEFCGYIGDGIFKRPSVKYLYDYDGIGLPVKLPTNTDILAGIRECYYDKCLLSLNPLGMNGENRENLARPEIGLNKNSNLSKLFAFPYQ